MGTNFYLRGHGHSDEPTEHIGKRSAAGLYCWDCHTTLCKSGERDIHADRGAWFDSCPRCGKTPAKEGLERSAAGRELGFNKHQPRTKTGVASCCSFSWAMDRDYYVNAVLKGPVCPNCGARYADADKVIEDEYGTLYSLDEFNQVLMECPVMFYDSVGSYFS